MFEIGKNRNRKLSNEVFRGIRMSRGNINYKYLRRRKNWFQRNWALLLVIAIIAVIVVILGICLFLYIQ